MKEGKQMQESKTPPEGDAEARLAQLEAQMLDLLRPALSLAEVDRAVRDAKIASHPGKILV